MSWSRSSKKNNTPTPSSNTHPLSGEVPKAECDKSTGPDTGGTSKEAGERDSELSDQRIFEQRVASGEIKFHSRTEKPEPEPREGRRKVRFGAVFRNNPTLLIVLVDIIVVLLVLTLVFPLIRPKAEDENFLGYSLSLHGYLHEGKVHTGLVVQPDPSYLAAHEYQEEAFQIEFRILETDTRVHEEFQPAHEGGEYSTSIIRKIIPLPEARVDLSNVRLRVTIDAGEESTTLEKKMRQ